MKQGKTTDNNGGDPVNRSLEFLTDDITCYRWRWLYQYPHISVSKILGCVQKWSKMVETWDKTVDTPKLQYSNIRVEKMMRNYRGFYGDLLGSQCFYYSSISSPNMHTLCSFKYIYIVYIWIPSLCTYYRELPVSIYICVWWASR